MPGAHLTLTCSATFPGLGWNQRPKSTGRSKGRQDKPDLTKPAQPALLQRKPLAPHSNPRRPAPVLGFRETTPQFPGASFLPQDSSPRYPRLPFPQLPKRSLGLLKTLSYLLQLQIHGRRHLGPLSAPARWRKPGSVWGKGAPWRGDYPLLPSAPAPQEGLVRLLPSFPASNS